VQIGAGTTTLDGDTSNLSNDNKSNSNQCGGSNSNDAVYQFTVTESGMLSIQLNASFRPSLYIRQDCANQGSLITCNANGFGNDTALNNLQATAGDTFFLFVDGYGLDNQAGAYSLSLTLEPSVCGDGKLDPGEQCDDGGTDPGDGCSPTCTFEQMCIVPEVSGDTFNNPETAPDGCQTVDFFPNSISSGNDNDWFCVNAQAGQTIVAETYVDQPGSCPNADTILELYDGMPQQVPNNTFCANNGAISCDDNNGPASCSRIERQVDKDGQYCLRVLSKFSINKINLYGLSVTVFLHYPSSPAPEAQRTGAARVTWTRSPSVCQMTAPPRSVRAKGRPSAASEARVVGCGCPKRLRTPQESTVRPGRTASRKGRVLDVRLPWCPALSRSARSDPARASREASSWASASPMSRTERRPRLRRKTSELSLALPKGA
jgi:cysteine-rich repeat protein